MMVCFVRINFVRLLQLLRFCGTPPNTVIFIGGHISNSIIAAINEGYNVIANITDYVNYTDMLNITESQVAACFDRRLTTLTLPVAATFIHQKDLADPNSKNARLLPHPHLFCAKPPFHNEQLMKLWQYISVVKVCSACIVVSCFTVFVSLCNLSPFIFF